MVELDIARRMHGVHPVGPIEANGHDVIGFFNDAEFGFHAGLH
jgi:hypothetical protein